DRAGQTWEKFNTQHCLDDAWRAVFGDEAERHRWLELLRSGVDIFALDYDAVLTAMNALSISAEGDNYLCVPPDPGIEVAALGASESALPGSAPAEALHTFTLDSSASHCFFRNSTTLTPLPAPIPLRLADPSGGPVLARSSTFLPCLVAAPCLCHLFSHKTLLWHHRLGHPSLPRLRGMHSRLLVSGLPRSLPPLPPSLALPCRPWVKGRKHTAPHSSPFPPTTASLQTLHIDVWRPARINGQDRERYFLLVVDHYTRYTTVFPLRSKGQVPDVLIPWIRAVHLQLRKRIREDLLVLHLHSDRGGEFSSDLLRDFCHGEGILQSLMLLASPQKNGVAERRIGLVMEEVRASMIHAAAPYFLWLIAVRYAAHQLNLWPRVSLSETSPRLHWTGKVGDASVFWIWGSRTFVRDTSADKLSSLAIPCVFLGFPSDALGWQFYHPTSRRVLPSQDVTFDESVPFYCLFPYRTVRAPPPPPATLPRSSAASGSAVSRGAEFASAEPGGAEPEGAEAGGAESEGAESWDAEPEGVEPQGAESLGAESQLRDWFAHRTRVRSGTARAGGSAAGGTGARGAHTSGTGAAGAGGVGGSGARDPGAGGTGAGDPGVGGAGARGAGAGDPGAVGTGARGAGAGGAGDGDTGAGGAGAGGVRAGDLGAQPAGTRGAGAGCPGAGCTVQRRPFFVPPQPLSLPPPDLVLCQVLNLPSFTGLTPSISCPPPHQSQPQLQPDSPLVAPSPYVEQTHSLTERGEPQSRPASPVRVFCTRRRVPRPCPPPIPCTHIMALPCAATPNVPRLLATVVADPLLESTAASALVAELVEFAAACRLDYATSLVAESGSHCLPSVGGECALGTDVLEDSQEEFECLAAAVPHLVAMLRALDGDLDAPHILTPRSYAEAITGTYIDAVPPSVANIVDGMWIFRVKRPPGSPSVFKARYVARGFSQRQGVDFFQTFSPTPKMTTLWVLLHIAAHRDYELLSLDFSTAFLQSSLHEEIWLRRPPGFTGSFLAGTQWSLRRPVYGLRQAPREWHNTLRTTLAALGFSPSTADPSLFLRTVTSLPPFYVLVYVDDLVFATADTEAPALVKSELQKRHTCNDLGPSTLPLPVLLATVHSPAYRSLALSSTFGRVLAVGVVTAVVAELGVVAAVVAVAVELFGGEFLAVASCGCSGVSTRPFHPSRYLTGRLVGVVAAAVVSDAVQLISWEFLEVAWRSCGGVRARPLRLSNSTCGTVGHSQSRCFSCLRDTWCAEFGDAAELPHWLELLRKGVDIFALDYDAILTTMYALTIGTEGDCSLTTLTPLFAPVLVRLADPSEGPVLAHSSTVLPCPAVPSGSLLGLHLPSFSTNLVSTAALQDAMVTTTTPRGQRVSICTCTQMGHHLATFTCRPGSSLYTLATKPPHVAASAQVTASGPVAPPCLCRLLSHQTLLWHHRLGHPSLPRLRGMHSRLLLSGLPRSLPPLPPSPAPPYLHCVEGRQRTAPLSSLFPPTTAPLQTLYMDVWGPARVSGQGRERYFLLVVYDYTRYTMVFPLRSKGEDLPVLHLHSDRGGEFSSDLLRDFCRGEGIL
ncbi:unnamed protein product, partial [Closterium sp. NIES-53]